MSQRVRLKPWEASRGVLSRGYGEEEVRWMAGIKGSQRQIHQQHKFFFWSCHTAYGIPHQRLNPGRGSKNPES